MTSEAGKIPIRRRAPVWYRSSLDPNKLVRKVRTCGSRAPSYAYAQLSCARAHFMQIIPHSLSRIVHAFFRPQRETDDEYDQVATTCSIYRKRIARMLFYVHVSCMTRIEDRRGDSANTILSTLEHGIRWCVLKFQVATFTTSNWSSMSLLLWARTTAMQPLLARDMRHLSTNRCSKTKVSR